MSIADVTWMDDYRAAAAEAAPVTYGTDVLGMAQVFDPGFPGFDDDMSTSSDNRAPRCPAVRAGAPGHPRP